jgi:hypothetical protein
MPAEHYHSGSNPDLGFYTPFAEVSKNFYAFDVLPPVGEMQLGQQR